MNPECYEHGKANEWTGGHVCPKCGSIPPFTQVMALVHLLLPDHHGKIPGKYCRYNQACEPSKQAVTEGNNREAATTVPAVVNCPGCIDVMDKLKIPLTRQSPVRLREVASGVEEIGPNGEVKQ